MTIEATRALEPFKEMRELVANFPSERYHVLLPTSYLGRSSLFIPTPVVVTVDPADERDVYKTPGSRDDSISFHAIVLERIAQAAGIDFDPSLTRHRHDRSKEPLVCEQIAAGWYIDSLGQRRLITSPWVTQDLRDKSPRANLLGRNGGTTALEVARQFICEQCGARARSSAIRKALTLKGSYKRSELLLSEQVDGKSVTRPKPFVAFRFRLDESDPDVKRALIARHHGAISEVFSSDTREAAEAPARANPDTLEDLEGEVVEQEPAIPDPPAEPTPPPDVPAIVASFQDRAKKRNAPTKMSDTDGTIAFTFGDVLGLQGKATKEDLGLVRRKMLLALFNIPVAELTAAQHAVIVEASKDPQGQRDLGAVFELMAEIDDGVRAVAAKRGQS